MPKPPKKKKPTVRGYIYSGEHAALWGPNSIGYVDSLDAAGIYTRKEAEQIIAGVGAEKMLQFLPVRRLTL